MSVSGELLCSFELLKPLDSTLLKSHMKKGRNERQKFLNSPVSNVNHTAKVNLLISFSLQANTHRVCHKQHTNNVKRQNLLFNLLRPLWTRRSESRQVVEYLPQGKHCPQRVHITVMPTRQRANPITNIMHVLKSLCYLRIIDIVGIRPELHALGSSSRFDVYRTDDRFSIDHDTWETASDRVLAYIGHLFSWSGGVIQKDCRCMIPEYCQTDI